jgi:hypothetical protein
MPLLRKEAMALDHRHYPVFCVVSARVKRTQSWLLDVVPKAKRTSVSLGEARYAAYRSPWKGTSCVGNGRHRAEISQESSLKGAFTRDVYQRLMFSTSCTSTMGERAAFRNDGCAGGTDLAGIKSKLVGQVHPWVWFGQCVTAAAIGTHTGADAPISIASPSIESCPHTRTASSPPYPGEEVAFFFLTHLSGNSNHSSASSSPGCMFLVSRPFRLAYRSLTSSTASFLSRCITGM